MDTSLTTLPKTDPAPILRYRDGQYAAELLATAIVHLDFFTWLHRNPGATTKTLCCHFEFADRPADVLLTLCRANGFIQTNSDDSHELTQLGCEHLVKGSPWYLGPYYMPLKDSPVVRNFLKVLRTGKPANWQAKEDGKDWHQSMLSEEFAREFTTLMNCRGFAFGQALATASTQLLNGRSHVLDVGGGSGVYAATLVAAHPHLKATVVEQAPVDAITRQSIEERGLVGRVKVVTADMFTEAWPSDADVHLLSNVLHDWDFPEVRAILSQSAKTLPSGGLLVIHEAFLNNDKTGPLPVAEYSTLLMSVSQGKCYAPSEYDSILRELNFEPGPYRDTIGDRGFMTAMKL